MDSLQSNSVCIDRVMYKTLHCVFYTAYLKACSIVLLFHTAVVFGIHEEHDKLAFSALWTSEALRADDLSAVFPTFLTIFTVVTLVNWCMTALAICTTADASRISSVFPTLQAAPPRGPSVRFATCTIDIEIVLIEQVRITLWWILVAVHLLAGFFSPIMCVHMDPGGSLQLASYLWLKIPIAVMYIVNSWYFTSRIINFVTERCIIQSELQEVNRLDYTEIQDPITQNVEVYIIES